jgi:glutamyl-tRNA synthetase
MQVRTRFAPSPTGQVHIGNIRTAIYSWLYARHCGGKFLLRIEDTDRERSTKEAINAVVDSMNWLGIDYDEEPVYQTQQLGKHIEAAEKLLSMGLAYKEDKGGTGKGEAVIFRMPGKDIAFTDLVKGTIKKAAKDLNDFVIVRSDGNPIFHLANVVDDITMGVTHVIRGDDHVENTFKHIALYEALEKPLPHFAHLPMIVNANGKPYSKRDGDAFIGDFRSKGFLPAALFNFLVLLGWSPGDDREILELSEIIRLFDLSRVKSAPAQMDMKKLEWMNGNYLRSLPQDEFEKGCMKALNDAGLWKEGMDMIFFRKVLGSLKDRINHFNDFPAWAGHFFNDEYPYEEKAVNKRLKTPLALTDLKEIRDVFSGLEPYTVTSTEESLRKLAESKGKNAGDYIHPVRVAITGMAVGVGLFDLLVILGKEKVLARIDRTLKLFENH